MAILAILAAGKVWVPLNPRNGDPELRRIVEFVEPSLVLADGEMAQRLAGIPASLRALEDLAGRSGDLAAVMMGPRSHAGIDLAEAQAIKFTGGTTGFPKGVIQPLRAWNTNIAAQIHELGLTPDDRYLVAAPLTHEHLDLYAAVAGCRRRAGVPRVRQGAGIARCGERARRHAVLCAAHAGHGAGGRAAPLRPVPCWHFACFHCLVTFWLIFHLAGHPRLGWAAILLLPQTPE
ncbi:AMP-binding protein [Cupriavidus basilensis]